MTVHWNVEEAPTVKFVTPDVALPGVVTTPVPAVVVHAPVPTDGTVAAKVAVVKLHTENAVPAFDVTAAFDVTVTVELAVQAPLVTVHWNVEEAPTVKFVTPDVALPGVVTTPVPAVVVQAPVPGDGTVAAKVAVVELHTENAVPAFEVAGAEIVMMISSDVVVQPDFVTVQRNVVEAPTVSPVTPEVGLAGVVATPVPEMVVQAPVPPSPEGSFPANVAVVTLHKV